MRSNMRSIMKCGLKNSRGTQNRRNGDFQKECPFPGFHFQIPFLFLVV